MDAVGQDLPGERTAQQRQAERPPARGGLAREEGRGPDQRLDVLDQVIAADVGFEVVGEKGDLRRQTRRHPRLQFRRNPPRAPGELLHPDHDPQRQGVAVPAVAPQATSHRRIGVEPARDEIGEGGIVDLFEVFHVMQVHAPELVARR